MPHKPSTQADQGASDWTTREDEPQWVSVMVDGELSPEQFSRVWVQLQHSEWAAQAWHTQHLIGDVLRRQVGTGCTTWNADLSQAFARNVVMLAKSADDGVAGQPDPTTVAHVHVEPSMQMPHVAIPLKQGEAANDSLFRWKALAGLASLSAVLSVAWNVWWASGSTASPQLAQAPVERVSPVVPASPAEAAPPAPLLVATERGMVERDARLDALIQAHRQHGGGTAWQVPAGFMRAATHTTAPHQP